MTILKKKKNSGSFKIVTYQSESVKGSFCRYKKALCFWSLEISLYLELFCFLSLFLCFSFFLCNLCSGTCRSCRVKSQGDRNIQLWIWNFLLFRSPRIFCPFSFLFPAVPTSLISFLILPSPYLVLLFFVIFIPLRFSGHFVVVGQRLLGEEKGSFRWHMMEYRLDKTWVKHCKYYTSLCGQEYFTGI